jgi:hypothetical protein
MNLAGGATLGVAGAVLSPLIALIIGDLISQEVHTRLERVPAYVLRMAASRLPLEIRDGLLLEWQCELAYILTDPSVARLPITRLLRGCRYALVVLVSARTTGREAVEAGMASRWRSALDRIRDLPATLAFGGRRLIQSTVRRVILMARAITILGLALIPLVTGTTSFMALRFLSRTYGAWGWVSVGLGLVLSVFCAAIISMHLHDTLVRMWPSRASSIDRSVDTLPMIGWPSAESHLLPLYVVIVQDSLQTPSD